MTLEEAVVHCLEKYNDKSICKRCRDDHKQLYDWLVELSIRRVECMHCRCYSTKMIEDIAEWKNYMNLTLNLKKEYFEEIKQGTKTEEYRLCTPYWQKRIEGKSFDRVILKLGYPKNSETDKILKFKYCGYEIKTIKHKHFGDTPVKVYAIKLENRIKTIIKIYQLCMCKNNKFKLITSNDPDCDGCYFENNCHKIPKGVLPECLALYRTSKKNIIFKKINLDKYRRY